MEQIIHYNFLHNQLEKATQNNVNIYTIALGGKQNATSR